MRVAWLLAASPLWAHMVSTSQSEFIVQQGKAQWTLRVPLYEFQHAADPSVRPETLFSFPGFVQTSMNCSTDGEMYVCRATLAGAASPIVVQCLLARHLAANHIHIFRALRDRQQTRLIFTGAVTEGTLDFSGTVWWEETVAVLRPALLTWGRWLLLGAAMIAAATWQHRLVFLTAQLLGPLLPLANPRFAEAAAALAVCYLAFEVLLLPQAPGRVWFIALAGVCAGWGLPLSTIPIVLPLQAAGMLLLLPLVRFAKPMSMALLACGGVWFLWSLR